MNNTNTNITDINFTTNVTELIVIVVNNTIQHLRTSTNGTYVSTINESSNEEIAIMVASIFGILSCAICYIIYKDKN